MPASSRHIERGWPRSKPKEETMSVMTSSPAAIAPISIGAAESPKVRVAPGSIAARMRATFERFVAPSYAEHQANDVDVFVTSKWTGYGRNGVTWDGIGWRI